MKSFLLILPVLLIFSACANRSAFEKFDMQIDQELSMDNIQSSKIKNGKNIDGTISAIYLNSIYPDRYNEREYFYVYIYQKDRQKMYDFNIDEGKLGVKLNTKLPLEAKELPANNEFSHLTSIKSKWQRYYLLSYEAKEVDTLSLVLESDQSFSDALNFQKVK